MVFRVPGVAFRPVEVNGGLGAHYLDSQRRLITAVTLDVVGGRITSISSIVIHNKLTHLGLIADVRLLLQSARRLGSLNPAEGSNLRVLLLQLSPHTSCKEVSMTECLYEDLAQWWQAISPPSEYEKEAALYVEMIQSAAHCPVRKVLELGSGGGNNASHMKRHFAMTLVEPSGEMLSLSERLNPECEHLPGDMRTVRLGRTFDAVFVHDAVMYMTTEEDLRAALETVAAHVAPGGGVLVAPDATTETFEEATEHGGGEDPEGRSARYLSWTLPPAPGGSVFETHYAFLLREPGGRVRASHDVHREGLFLRDTWLRLFGEVGLTARLVPREIEGSEYDSFVARHQAP